MIALLVLAKVLTLSDALATAQKNQPQIMQAHANTRAAEARVIENRAPLLPQVTGSALYQRRTGSSAQQPGLGVNVPTKNSLTTFNNWNFGVTLSQLVYDFGVSLERFRASQSLAKSQLETEKATLLTIEQQVRTSYFNARAQKALIQVGQETLANQERHLQQIEGFVKVGVRPEIDLAQARTDRANALVQLITAQGGYGTALAQLNLSMGIDAPADFDVAEESLPPVDGEDQPTDALLGEALKARPEVAAFEAQVRAQQQARRGAKGAYAPSFSVGTGVTANGTDITDMAYNWNFSASMSWGIFSGLATYGLVQEADATLTALEAQLAAEKQQVRFDVEQSKLTVRTAKAALAAAEEALTNARERLRLAEGRYQAGVGSVIELGDAQLAMTAAQQQRVQAEYTLASARALFLRALGRR